MIDIINFIINSTFFVFYLLEFGQENLFLLVWILIQTQFYVSTFYYLVIYIIKIPTLIIGTCFYILNFYQLILQSPKSFIKSVFI